MIDFKHVHDIDIFINDKWRKYVGGNIGWLLKITRRLELCFWPTRKRSQPSQGDFFAKSPSNVSPAGISLNLQNTVTCSHSYQVISDKMTGEDLKSAIWRFQESLQYMYLLSKWKYCSNLCTFW
jgi:hypothetical protein